MSGDELKVREFGERRGDARRVIVRRGLVERADERLSLGLAHARMVEPVDAAERREHGGHRPLATGRVGNRDMRDVTGSVVPSQHGIACSRPVVGSGVVRQRQGRHQRTPPAGGVAVDGLELDGAPRGADAAAGNAEGDGRRLAVGGEGERTLVEVAALERVGGAALVRAHGGTRASNGVAHGLERSSRVGGDAIALALAEEIRDEALLAGAEVEHAAARRMPGLPSRKRHVDMVLV